MEAGAEEGEEEEAEAEVAEPEEDGPARLMVDGAARRAIRAANSVSMDFDMDFDRECWAAGGCTSVFNSM